MEVKAEELELGEGEAIRAGYLARYLQYERALRACDKSGRNISCGKCEVLDKRDLVPGCLATDIVARGAAALKSLSHGLNIPASSYSCSC